MLSPASIAAFSKDLDRWLALSPGSIVSGLEHARAIAETAAARVLDAANLVDPPDAPPARGARRR